MSGMAEVLAAHFDLQWSFEFGGFVCVECGWQETYARPYAKDAEASARASHLASVLTDAGFGPVKEAGAVALEEAGNAPLPAPGRKGETSGFRMWLRARAAAVRGEA